MKTALRNLALLSRWRAAVVLALICLLRVPADAKPGPTAKAVAGAYIVRIAYIIPSDRKPMTDYRTKATTLLDWIRTFYADRMEQNGFGRMTFEYEKAADGRAAVHLIRSPLTATVFADTGHAKYVIGKYWQHAVESVRNAGFAPYTPGEIWLCFCEAQDQLPDGSLHNGTAQGDGSFERGVMVCSSTMLALADPKLLNDHRPYGGRIVPAIGPYPLILHKSFADYDGDDVSSIVAVQVGAAAHEIGHCFTLQHCYLNDLNFDGNLMGNGFRGWRGAVMPARFASEDTRLDRPSALMLRVNPFLRRPTQRVPDHKPPRVTITTPPGPMPIERGTFRLSFTVSQPDGPGIAFATLQCAEPRDGVGIVAFKEFDGVSAEVSGSLATTQVNAGREEKWTVRVFDNQGCYGEQTVALKAPVDGLGPRAFISVGHTDVVAGESISFDAGPSRPLPLRSHWDFGDGGTSESMATAHTFTKPGLVEVRLRVVDAAGRQNEISQFLWVRPLVSKRAGVSGVEKTP